ncbi:P-loop containing nucleoside triphosphate hydrolase protein [Pelagophyceae sp. CCMP2097]|nr:P-loop containing nucleoside triphosphate hydrolase protein [Pelagophyceae sp. CCMP2097]
MAAFGGSAATRRVTVAVRVRPVSESEARQNALSVVQVQGNRLIVSDPVEAAARAATGSFTVPASWRRSFGFDACFCDMSQSEVFQNVGVPLLRHAWAGFNSSILAYGQTGAGKTHSMIGGTGDQAGLIPRICCGLFDAIEASGDVIRVEVSYMEVYQESVRDLLMPTGKPLRVREHPDHGAHVPQLTHVQVRTRAEALALLDVGAKSRATAPTRANAASSRSHAVFTLNLTRECHRHSDALPRPRGWWDGVEVLPGGGARPEDDFDDFVVTSCTRLVDLAGSERVAVTGTDGARLREAKSINKSLAALCDVIEALAANAFLEEKDSLARSRQSEEPAPSPLVDRSLSKALSLQKRLRHVPYRNSALTWLLKESLGGNGFATMLAAVAPCDLHYDETVATLKYAERARQVKRSAVPNVSAPTPVKDAALQAQEDDDSSQRVPRSRAKSRAPRSSEGRSDVFKTKTFLNWGGAPSESSNGHSYDDRGSFDASERLSEGRFETQKAFNKSSLEVPTWPRLTNLNPDQEFAGSRTFALSRQSSTLIGAVPCAQIRIRGGEIEERHAVVAAMADDGSGPTVVVICSLSTTAATHVDGRRIEDVRSSLRVGDETAFRLGDKAASRLSRRLRATARISLRGTARFRAPGARRHGRVARRSGRGAARRLRRPAAVGRFGPLRFTRRVPRRARERRRRRFLAARARR